MRDWEAERRGVEGREGSDEDKVIRRVEEAVVKTRQTR